MVQLRPPYVRLQHFFGLPVSLTPGSLPPLRLPRDFEYDIHSRILALYPLRVFADHRVWVFIRDHYLPRPAPYPQDLGRRPQHRKLLVLQQHHFRRVRRQPRLASVVIPLYRCIA